MSRSRHVDEELRKPPERLVNPDQPAPTAPVEGTAQALPPRRCDRCGAEVAAAEPEHHREVDDYVMWFCSSGCAQSKPP